MAYGKYGWPSACLICCIGLFVQEAYIVTQQCEILKQDYRWIGRSAYFCLIPLTTCMTLECWAKAGKDFSGLAISSNRRIPPLIPCIGQWECTIPSFCVGGSFCWYILCFTWVWCDHVWAAPICAGVGVCLTGFGVWFSQVLKKGIQEDNDEDEGKDPNLAACSSNSKKTNDVSKVEEEHARLPQEEAHPPTRPSKLRPSYYDPEDNVLTNLVSHRTAASWQPTSKAQVLPTTTTTDPEFYNNNNRSAPPAMMTTASSSLPQDDEVHYQHDMMMMVKGRSLGAYDCPPPVA